MNKINNFFKGRYGIDELYRFLLIIICFIIIINLFINSFIIGLIELLLFIIMIYRALSKKIYKRVKENNIYLDIKRKIKNIFIKDKYYIYKKFHYCKTKLRLKKPNSIGIKHVICPNCNKRNRYLIIKK